jgi:hypothetical protein
MGFRFMAECKNRFKKTDQGKRIVACSREKKNRLEIEITFLKSKTKA